MQVTIGAGAEEKGSCGRARQRRGVGRAARGTRIGARGGGRVRLEHARAQDTHTKQAALGEEEEEEGVGGRAASRAWDKVYGGAEGCAAASSR